MDRHLLAPRKANEVQLTPLDNVGQDSPTAQGDVTAGTQYFVLGIGSRLFLVDV